MATFIPGVTDNPQSLQSPVGSPDFSFLQQNLYKSNQEYEQGLSQVKNDYSSILNAPLTSNENIDQRKQYIDQIQQGLKKVSTTDLSLPQNVTQAENLYQPFWKDEYLLKDMAYTRQIQGEYQKAYSARDSKDKEQQSSFDEASLGPLNQAMYDLKNAKRNPQDFGNLSAPSWVPFKDIGQTMSNWKDKDKPEISWDDADSKPGYIIHHVNGADSKPGWVSMISGKVDKSFDPQFHVLGQNEVNARINNFISQNPGATKDQARQYIAQKEYPNFVQNRKENLNNISAAYNDYSARIEKLNQATNNQKNGLVNKQENLKALYQAKLEQITAQKDQAQKSYNDAISPDSLPNMTKNLEEYYAGNIRNGVVDQYANTFSQNTGGSKIETDAAFWSAKNINVQMSQLQESQREHNLVHQDKEADRNMSYAIAALEHPGLLNSQNSTIGIPNARVEEKATNLVSKATPLEIYTNQKENDKNNIGMNLYGVPNDKYRGITQILLDPEVGLTPTELATLNDIQMRHHVGNLTENEDGKFVPKSVEEGNLYNSAVSKLAKALGKNPTEFKTVDDVSKEIVDYSTKWLTTTHQNMTDPDAVQYYTGLITQTTDLYKKFEIDEAKRQGMVKTNVITSSDPSIRNLAIKKPDGSIDIVDQRYIANQLHQKGLESVTVKLPNGQEQNISTDEIAKAYWNGTYKLSDDRITINGENYPVIGVNGKRIPDHWLSSEHSQRTVMARKVSHYFSGDPTMTSVMHNPNSIVGLYGQSGEAKQKIATIQSKVVPNYEYYQGKTGEIPMSIGIPVTGKGNERNIAYAQDVVLPGNNTFIHDEKGEPVDPTIKQDIVNIVQHRPELLGDMIHIIPQSSVYGGNKIQLSIDVAKGDKDIPSSVQGKTFTIDIAPDTKSEKLQTIPQLTGESYDPLYSSPEYANAAQRAVGIDYTMRYDKMSNKFLLDGTRTYTDPNTGKEITTHFSQARNANDGGAMGARSVLNSVISGAISQNTQNQLIHTQRK